VTRQQLEHLLHRLARAEILLDRLATVEADPAILDRARAAIQQAYRGFPP
jgi:hypothetical protein